MVSLAWLASVLGCSLVALYVVALLQRLGISPTAYTIPFGHFVYSFACMDEYVSPPPVKAVKLHARLQVYSLASKISLPMATVDLLSSDPWVRPAHFNVEIIPALTAWITLVIKLVLSKIDLLFDIDSESHLISLGCRVAEWFLVRQQRTALGIWRHLTLGLDAVKRRRAEVETSLRTRVSVPSTEQSHTTKFTAVHTPPSTRRLVNRRPHRGIRTNRPRQTVIRYFSLLPNVLQTRPQAISSATMLSRIQSVVHNHLPRHFINSTLVIWQPFAIAAAILEHAKSPGGWLMILCVKASVDIELRRVMFLWQGRGIQASMIAWLASRLDDQRFQAPLEPGDTEHLANYQDKVYAEYPPAYSEESQDCRLPLPQPTYNTDTVKLPLEPHGPKATSPNEPTYPTPAIPSPTGLAVSTPSRNLALPTKPIPRKPPNSHRPAPFTHTHTPNHTYIPSPPRSPDTIPIISPNLPLLPSLQRVWSRESSDSESETWPTSEPKYLRYPSAIEKTRTSKVGLDNSGWANSVISRLRIAAC